MNFFCIGLILISNNNDKNISCDNKNIDSEESLPPLPSLSKHIKSIRSQQQIVKHIQNKSEDNISTKGKFTIS